MEWTLLLVALVLSTTLVKVAYTAHVLNRSGAVTAFLLLFIQISAGWRYGAMSLVYILVVQNPKSKNYIPLSDTSPRNWKHVFCHDISVIIMIIGAIFTTKAFIGGIVGHFSYCHRDSWVSELLSLMGEGTKWRRTLKAKLEKLSCCKEVGAAFFYTGLLVETCSTDAALKQLLLIPLSTVAAVIGPIIHSLIATKLLFSPFFSVPKEVSLRIRRRGSVQVHGLAIIHDDTITLLSLLVTSFLTAMACVFIF